MEGEILGKGASKTVFRAFDEYEGIEVAWNQVKLHDFLQSPQDLERLYCEIHLLKTLKHKNIMKFYTSWVDRTKRNINFITELFTSGTLRQYRLRYRNVNLRAVKHWCRQILMGLVYLHSHDPPVIHRDLKCDNIFINGNQGEVKIGDLGLAAILRKSRAVHCVGTPEFMAPEVYEEEYNELVDIYSFGMCVLEMVTFDYPYSECTHPAQIYKKIISGTKPEALYRVMDPEVRRFVEKCLVAASQRLPASELLKDPFLHIDGLHPVLDNGDIVEIGHIFPPLSVTCQRSNGSFINNCFSNLLCDEPGLKSRLDYIDDDLEIHSMELFSNHEEEHFGDVDIAIKGRRKEDGGVFLRLRITDRNGHVRNIYFPFDVKADTALNVADEMVSELGITDYGVTRIAEMIDGELSTLVPGWKTSESLSFLSKNQCEHCTSDVFSCNSPLDFLSSKGHGYENLRPHYGRFEEITYEEDGSKGAPAPAMTTSSSHSDGLNSRGEASRGFLFNEEGDHLCSSCYTDEEIGGGKKTSDELCDPYVKYENRHHECASSEADEDGSENRHELSESKEVLRLADVEDGLSCSSLPRSKMGTVKSSHFANNLRFHIPSDDRAPALKVNLNFNNFFAISEPMVTSKSFYTGNILPSPILRTKSLPVDAVDV
ncbi:probable serine/threonine-protein kinase WNK9 isoform X2 [Phalaenopsis equestris]|uniref:probable serine/threonine-protein kinase WNK9 isoform X2 n=1 Tax=Phalaenopsis equestris TaxID=78828 RepID=UPI0009E54CDF|nr:probable serine/threonine-protein kinase WNK9 isoform X2 [Phalaenopsis equestris]